MPRSPALLVMDMDHAYWGPADDARIPEAAKRIRLHVRTIVHAVSQARPGETVSTTIRCTKRPAHKPCPGVIQGRHETTEDHLAWICGMCGAGGLATNWRGCPDDLSRAEVSLRRVRQAVPVLEIRLPLVDFYTIKQVEVFSLSPVISQLVETAVHVGPEVLVRGSYAALDELRDFIAIERDGFMRVSEENAGKPLVHPPRGSSAETYSRIFDLLNEAIG